MPGVPVHPEGVRDVVIIRDRELAVSDDLPVDANLVVRAQMTGQG
jgi:hypothetical protein